MSNFPDPDDYDEPDDDELDTEDDDGELSDEDLEEIIRDVIAKEPELASDLLVLRQYPTYLKAIARAVRCGQRIRRDSDFPNDDGSDDDDLFEMARAEEPQLVAQLQQIIDNDDNEN